MLSVCIYYSDFKYTIIKKEPKMTWIQLVSEIGGIMGFYIGTSFLSFLEIVDLITVVLRNYSKKIQPENNVAITFTK